GPFRFPAASSDSGRIRARPPARSRHRRPATDRAHPRAPAGRAGLRPLPFTKEPRSMERIDVAILGRDYSLACPPEQKDALLAAVRLVDQRMLAIKGAGKIVSNERIAVMAAIQIANELLSMRAPDGPLGNVALGDFKSKIESMNGMLDEVLSTAV